MFKNKLKKKDKGDPSAIYCVHKELEYLVPLLDRVLDELWLGANIGGMGSSSIEKLRAIARLTSAVKKVISSYDKVICENLNISDKPSDGEGLNEDD